MHTGVDINWCPISLERKGIHGRSIFEIKIIIFIIIIIIIIIFIIIIIITIIIIIIII